VRYGWSVVESCVGSIIMGWLLGGSPFTRYREMRPVSISSYKYLDN